MLSAASYLLIAAAAYTTLFLLGWPLWALLGRLRPSSVSTELGAPLAGMALLQVFGWYWWGHASGGLWRGLPVLVVVWIGLGVAAVLAVRRRPPGRRDVVDSSERRQRVLASAVLGLAAFALVASIFGSAVTTRLTPKSYNLDTPAYAVLSQHLEHHGFGDPGHIAGANLGDVARDDVTGAFAVLAWGATVTNLGVWQVATPVLLAAVVLLALGARDLARRFGVRSEVAAGFVGLLAVLPPLTYEVVAGFFLSQVLGMALGVALVLVVLDARERREWHAVAVDGLRAAVLFVALLLTYAHMGFAAVAFAALLASAVSVGRGWLRSSARVVSVCLLAMAVARVVVPGRWDLAVERTRTLAEGSFGFALTGLTPLDLLGFHRDFLAPSIPTLVFESLVVLTVVGLAVAILWRRQRGLAMVGAFIVIGVLGSYGLVYLQRGVSYVQWKWVSFFQPLLVVAVASLVVCAAGLLLRRWWGNGRWPAVLGSVAGVGVAGILVLNAHAAIGKTTWWDVWDDLSDLGPTPATRGVASVNVEMPSPWERMWAWYFLAPRTVYVRDTGDQYFGAGTGTSLSGEWTLEAVKAPVPHPPGADVRRINESYRLVRVTGGARPSS